MKPDFEVMSKAQLRAYVLEHKEDIEALRALMSRPDPKGIKYSFPNTEEGGFENEYRVRVDEYRSRSDRAIGDRSYN